MKTPRNSLVLTALVLAATANLAAKTVLAPADPKIYLGHVKTLADPSMQGRGAGTDGLEKARDYIVASFERLGLKPGATQASYLQPFTVTTGAVLGPDNRFEIVTDEDTSAVGLREDYVPLTFSASGSVTAPLVFAGYGASATEFDYDDYFHLPVEGKILVILRYEPPEFNPNDGPPTHHSHLISKAINARNRGARAVILVNGKLEENAEDVLIKFGRESGPEDAGIPMIHAKNATLDQWLRTAGKPSLAELQAEIDENSRPQSFLFPDGMRATIAVDIERQQATVQNVLGYLPGETDEYVILGAHYDHLGYGDRSSLAPSQIGKIHHGADDNASGTAALLELARIFSRQRTRQRGILFMAFAAEEIGLLGARAWVEEPTLPVEKAVAMLNMDMVGRIRDHKVYLGGLGTGASFEEMVDDVIGGHELKVESSKSGYSASDHTMFLTKQIPVLFFFSGLHSDYHKPSDTWDKIDSGTAAELVDLVAEISDRLVAGDGRPQFVRVASERRPGGGSGGKSGYGAYFGSVPDFGEVETGVMFADVTPGSPADKAGLKGGDILIEFDGKAIENLYDFTYALRAGKIGQTVTVKVLRDGKPLVAEVTLEQRK